VNGLRPLTGLVRGAVCFLLLVSLSGAAETPIPSVPDRWVTDAAGFLSEAVRQDLDSRLAEFERSTGHQLIVYIGRTTGDAPIEDWAVRAFESWRVGRKGIDDGLVLFLMTDDRRMRIEVGYGLEGTVTDAVASRIIHEVMTPSLQAGDNDGAVRNAVDSLISVLGGKGESGTPATPAAKRLSPVQLIFIGFLVLGFLILLITHPALAIWLLINLISGGRGGGGGGGGFSGGGGRSGGGGASGSW
jgi:uncharacterized protein